MGTFGGAQPIVTDGLVFAVDAANYQSYPGSGTTWSDLSGNGNHATLINGPTFNPNGYIQFDGSNDLVNTNMFGGRNPSTSPFTVQAIIRSNTLAGQRLWIDATGNGANQRFYSAFDDGGDNPLGIQGSPYSDFTLNNTNWTYQTIVMDGSIAQSYRNGIPSYTKSYTSYTLYGDIVIGGRSGYNWLGDIAFVKIYNRALTASEVSQNYNALKGRFGL